MQRRNYKLLASLNRKDIDEYNRKMLFAGTLIGTIIMILPTLAVPFSNTKDDVLSVYLLAGVIFLTMFFVFNYTPLKKYTQLGAYIFFSNFFALAVYLSVFHSPDMRATIIIGAFCLIPLGLIDRPFRMNVFVVFWFLVHTVLAFIYKPEYAFDDTINLLIFVILGCFFGDKMIWRLLKGYESQRLLTIEKETDVLTGFYNRRKLFDTFTHLETSSIEKPSGVLMIDTNHFKEFNDNYGHVIGDKYLAQLGIELKKLSQSYKIVFYRYGGEEFVALIYGYSKDEILSIAETLRSTIEDIKVEGWSTTVSIGVAYCGDIDVKNYEEVLIRADKASYNAKNTGRNKVCFNENKLNE
jgi:diguanylate cyclase (GGDEF)-like protein